MGRVTETVSRNIGVLRRQLRPRFTIFVRSPVTQPEAISTRDYWAALITDEEKADIAYSRLADLMPLDRQTISSMASDERRHAQQLKSILDRLEKEGKLV